MKLPDRKYLPCEVTNFCDNTGKTTITHKFPGANGEAEFTVDFDSLKSISEILSSSLDMAEAGLNVSFSEFLKVQQRICSNILGYPATEAAFATVEDWEQATGEKWKVFLSKRVEEFLR